MAELTDTFNKYHAMSGAMFVEAIALKVVGRKRVYKTWSHLLFNEREDAWSDMQNNFLLVWAFYFGTSTILKMESCEKFSFAPFNFLFDVSLKLMPVLQFWLTI